MTDDAAKTAGKIAHDYLAKGDPSGWFEPLYAGAGGDVEAIPWAQGTPSPSLVDWLQREQPDGNSQPALVVGCGLGDDAEALAGYGYAVTAFDVSESAIHWCRQRWPDTKVNYQVADLLNPPSAWEQAYAFVLENITVQALPVALRSQVIQNIARFVMLQGSLLAMGWLVEDNAEWPGPPWPMTRAEMKLWQQAGLHEVKFELLESHFRALYRA